MLNYILQAAGTIAIVIILIMFIREMLQRKRNQHLEDEVMELAEQHDQLLSEVFEPYNKSSDMANLTRGKTKERFEELSEEFFTIMNTTREAQQNLEGLRVTRASYGSVLAVLPRAKQQLTEVFEKLEKTKRSFDQLNEEDSEISTQVLEEKKKLTKLKDEITVIQDKTGYSLKNLTQKYQYVASQIEEISTQVQQLDFVTAMEELYQIKEDVEELKQRTQRIKGLLPKEAELTAHVENQQNERVASLYQKFKAALEAGEADRASHFMQEAFKEAKL